MRDKKSASELIWTN